MATMHLGGLTVTSPDFEADGRMPDRTTSRGDDVSPVLEIRSVPSTTRSLAVVCHDPDAPTTFGFDHWVAYDIPPDRTEIGRGPDRHVTQGTNSFGELGYRGPAPPQGHGVHHYFFHVYALDTDLDAEGGLTRRELLDRIEGHIIEQARLVGTYSVEDS